MILRKRKHRALSHARRAAQRHSRTWSPSALACPKRGVSHFACLLIRITFDVEWTHAVAPGAQIILDESNSQSLSDLMAGVATAASQPGVSVVSMSWGFAEGQAIFASDEAMYDSYFDVPGVTFVASTGDYPSDRSRVSRLFAQRGRRRRHEPDSERRRFVQQRDRLGLSVRCRGRLHRLRRRPQPVRARGPLFSRASSPRVIGPHPTFRWSPIRPREPGSPIRIISIPAIHLRSWAARACRRRPGRATLPS